MRVVQNVPPIFTEIDAAFNVRGKPILYAWGDKIFNPAGVHIPPELVAHEQVHGERQGTDVVGWWRRYIAEPEFRLAEELPAHVAEFKALCIANAHKWVSQRSMRRTFAAHVGRRLAAPLYGGLITADAAKAAILEAARL